MKAIERKAGARTDKTSSDGPTRFQEACGELNVHRDTASKWQRLAEETTEADLGYSAQNRAAAIAIKARRKAGEMMKAIEKSVGGRPLKNQSAQLTGFQQAQTELNVSKETANKWQRLADETTEKEIDEKAAEYTAAQMELTTG